MKALLLPFLQIPSGHHQVADALAETLLKYNVEVSKIDILSYSNSLVERLVSSSYLQWIKLSPTSYKHLYKFYAKPNAEKPKHFKLCERLFLSHMKELIREKDPDIVICTHAFPSALVSRLKQNKEVQIPVINAYTDFFINGIWGIKGIDYHFVASDALYRELLQKHHLRPRQVFKTGIPISPIFAPRKHSFTKPFKVLVSGGSMGLGSLTNIVNATHESNDIHYFILCGKNKELFQDLKHLELDHVTPLPYLSSREMMNSLYNKVDAIITKPGGVTASEALHKRLPIFVHSALPGQEEYNFNYLQAQGLAFEVTVDTIEEVLLSFFSNEHLQASWRKSIESYHSKLNAPAQEALQTILGVRRWNRLESR